MNETTVAVLSLLVFGWAIVSGALARRNVTGPLLFAAVGYLVANPDWGWVQVNVDASSVHVIAEVALALVLFSDASRVKVRELRSDVSVPARLLALGLPLSVGLGTALAAVLLLDLPWGLAGFVGAALAPTDAALSAAVLNDERIPMRIRRALNVESGLNDGIATPIVTMMLAVAASQIGLLDNSPSFEISVALREVGLGVVVGTIAGMGGAALIVGTARRGWISPGGRRLAALAVALGSFAVAIALDANGFIAAFVAGIAFGASMERAHDDPEEIDQLNELGGELLALVVWFLFGAAIVPIALGLLDARIVLYAALSLTVVRMLPVGLSLVGSGLSPRSVGFIAWFGPRGLASVVFAMLAVEELGSRSPATNRAVATVAITVMASVVLHGLTAGPGARWFVRGEARAR